MLAAERRVRWFSPELWLTSRARAAMLRIGISSSSFGSLIAAESDPMIEITRIDCAWPTDKGAHLESELLARDCGVR
jgi:hypothetical protein